jgi:hypothetical protein
MSEKDVQPVAWSVFDKRTQKHWYTNESVNTAGYYAKEYSHREPDGSPSMLVVPLYEHPPAADVQPVAYETENELWWHDAPDINDHIRKTGIPLYRHPPAADVQELERNEQYQIQMAAISTASLGYWQEGDEISPDYDTVALRDTANLYDRYKAERADALELVEALKKAEAALSDIGDADREPEDDIAWCERRATQDLQMIRAALAKWEGK